MESLMFSLLRDMKYNKAILCQSPQKTPVLPSSKSIPIYTINYYEQYYGICIKDHDVKKQRQVVTVKIQSKCEQQNIDAVVLKKNKNQVQYNTLFSLTMKLCCFKTDVVFILMKVIFALIFNCSPSKKLVFGRQFLMLCTTNKKNKHKTVTHKNEIVINYCSLKFSK